MIAITTGNMTGSIANASAIVRELERGKNEKEKENARQGKKSAENENERGKGRKRRIRRGTKIRIETKRRGSRLGTAKSLQQA
jgi:hypothetical protein